MCLTSSLLITAEKIGINDGDVAYGLTLLPAVCQVFEEVDGDLVEVGQEYADVDGEEVIDLALGAVLGGEKLRWDLHLVRGRLDLLALS